MTDQQTSSREGDKSREWFEDWFSNPLYLKVYQHRDDSEAVRCVDTVLALTRLQAGPAIAPAVLDIACGAGRHALAFARKGFTVAANDLSPFLLDMARREARNAGLELSFSSCDMRTIRLGRHFDLIVQLFSSFGYFETDREDRLVLDNVSAMLGDDGWYVLDLMNPAWLASHFRPRTEKNIGSLHIIEERTMKSDKVVKRLTLKDTQKDEVYRFTESMRLFGQERITAMLADAGMQVSMTIGDYQGNPFEQASSPRLMLFCRKR